MEKSENYTELRHDVGADDEVEILEVVGIDDDAPAVEQRTAGAEIEDDEEGDEYLLDFDDPDPGLAEAVGLGASSAPGSVEDEADEQQRLVRLRADYDNLRKRIDRERKEFERYANFSLVGGLLPVIDNLERALAVDSSGEQARALHEGLVMIHRQLLDQLRCEGLSAIDTVGQPFDPNLHDAVATDALSTEPANTIVEEMQKGYLFQDRVLRPAMVKVSTGDATPRDATPFEED